MANLLTKKMAKEAQRHGLDVNDLDYAMQSLDYLNDGYLEESKLYMDLINNDTTTLWQVATGLNHWKEQI